MPEEVATAAESSPAEEPQKAPEKQETVSVPTNAEDYAEWRMTGKLPESPGRKPSKGEDSATSKTTSVDSEESESSPVSETALSAGKRSAQKRIDQLTAEKESYRRENEGYRKELEEYRTRAGKQDAKQPESSSVPQTAPSDGRPKKPNHDDFTNWADYEKAKEKYDEDLIDWKADQKIKAFIQTQQNQAQQNAIRAKLEAADQRYGDGAGKLIDKTGTDLFQNSQVHQGVKQAIWRSDVMVDALFVIGGDARQLEAFTTLAVKDPLEALREWYEVEKLVKAELGKNGHKSEPNGNAPMRDENGQFISSKPPARMRHTPAPATELGGSTSPPGDERDRAAASGDVRRFFSEGNRRDLARWKGQL